VTAPQPRDDERPTLLRARKLGTATVHSWWIVPGSNGADGPLYRRGCNSRYRVIRRSLDERSITDLPQCQHGGCR
jgi:hypothetical protein